MKKMTFIYALTFIVCSMLAVPSQAKSSKTWKCIKACSYIAITCVGCNYGAKYYAPQYYEKFWNFAQVHYYHAKDKVQKINTLAHANPGPQEEELPTIEKTVITLWRKIIGLSLDLHTAIKQTIDKKQT